MSNSKLLMRWSLIVVLSKGGCSYDDEKDVRLQQNLGAKDVRLQQNLGAPGLFLPLSAKISKDEH
jgi:hypothetical protein